jgi:hypothetical protein
MSTRNRRLPAYRPIPTDLRKRRRIAPDYANFYGSYITKDGRKKRFSFKVKVDPYKNRIVLGKLIKMTCMRIKDNRIPPVKNGYVFDDFGDLLSATKWMRVRLIKPYKAGMEYER